MAIIHGFRSTTYNRAFFLNAMATTITVVVALFVQTAFERAQHDEAVPALSAGLVVATIGATFVAALIAYYSLHWMFGFGDAMLASKIEVHFNKDERKHLVTQFKKGEGNAVIHVNAATDTSNQHNPQKSAHTGLNPLPQSLSLSQKSLVQ